MIRMNGHRRPPNRVDEAMLVRLVQDDHGSLLDAAAELRRRVHDPAALARARARVAATMAERPSAFGDRAIVTLNAALTAGDPGDGRPAGSAAW